MFYLSDIIYLSLGLMGLYIVLFKPKWAYEKEEEK